MGGESDNPTQMSAYTRSELECWRSRVLSRPYGVVRLPATGRAPRKPHPRCSRVQRRGHPADSRNTSPPPNPHFGAKFGNETTRNSGSQAVVMMKTTQGPVWMDRLTDKAPALLKHPGHSRFVQLPKTTDCSTTS